MSKENKDAPCLCRRNVHVDCPHHGFNPTIAKDEGREVAVLWGDLDSFLGLASSDGLDNDSESGREYQRAKAALQGALDRQQRAQPTGAAEAKDQLRPNVMRCAACRLRVTGALATGDCPNGCGPLWPVSWKDECRAAESENEQLRARFAAPPASTEPQQAQGEQELRSWTAMNSGYASAYDENEMVVKAAKLDALFTGKRLIPADQSGSAVTKDTSVTIGVGDGSGKLFVHGDYDSIKRVQSMIFELEELRRRKSVKLQFPVMLRKMWSGGEVQDWLNSLPGPLFPAPKPTHEEIDQAVASLQTPDDVKGRVMSEMFWKGVYALQAALKDRKP